MAHCPIGENYRNLLFSASWRPTNRADAPTSIGGSSPQPTTDVRQIVSGVDIVREGRAEPFLNTRPTLSSTSAHWGGITLENYNVPAVFIPRHEHPEHFLHLVLSGAVKYEVTTHGRSLRFTSRPGTTFLLPHGTVDEVNWRGPTQRLAVAIHPNLLTSALDETSHESDIELPEHWDLIDPHVSALLLEMKADLNDGSPAGSLYGESLANALAVYLLKRYAVRRQIPVAYKGGLPGYRLKRVLNYIGDNLAESLSLSQLAAVAGMSPHYFSELFKQSTGTTPHKYVLIQRIELAKQHLSHSKLSVIDIGLESGFQNPSHFARVFKKCVGVAPSGFQRQTRGSNLRPCKSAFTDSPAGKGADIDLVHFLGVALPTARSDTHFFKDCARTKVRKDSISVD